MIRAARVGLMLTALATSALADETCPGAAGVPIQVRAVTGPLTMTLADGSEIRLAGLAPPAPDGAERAASALRALIDDQAVTLRPTGEPDRHGRLPALVFRDGETLQQRLLSDGHARLRGESLPCLALLREAERAARIAGRGLWADPAQAAFDAGDLDRLRQARGHFALVRGRVVSVRESGATLYVNFGRRWSEDFTATLARRSEAAFTAAGVPLRKLAGKEVLLRGVIEERGGPWIDLVRPGQIETADTR